MTDRQPDQSNPPGPFDPPPVGWAPGSVVVGIGLAGAGVAALWLGRPWLDAAAVLAMIGLAWVLIRAATASRRDSDAIEAATTRLAATAGVEPLGAIPTIGAVERRLFEARGAAEARRRETLDLLDAIDTPVVATDAAGSVVVCNRAAGALIGGKPDGLMGRPIESVFTRADLAQLHREASDGRRVRARVRLARADGTFIYETSAIPAGERSAGVHPVVMTFRDVTELSRALQVKTDFVANASHELRTPIAALRIAADTLASGGTEDREVLARVVAMIGNNTARLEEMVRDLLDLSKLESPELSVRSEEFPASRLEDTLRSLLESECRRRSLTLRFEVSPDAEVLKGDETLVTLILKNLAENAVKFAYERTAVRITVVAGSAASGAARFEVTDEGIGIPLDQQQRIFERFYQVDPARAGTAERRGSGLGLAIVKHAVRTLGGTIRVQSVWKQGTTLTVEIPGMLPVSAPAPSPAREDPTDGA